MESSDESETSSSASEDDTSKPPGLNSINIEREVLTSDALDLMGVEELFLALQPCHATWKDAKSNCESLEQYAKFVSGRKGVSSEMRESIQFYEMKQIHAAIW